MATTLTTSYKKIATINLTYGKIYTYARYTGQNKTTNVTTYQIKSTYYTTQGGGVSFSSATAKLDGTTKNYGYTTMKKGETTIQELTRTLTHNNDGSSPTKTINTSWDATFGGDGSSSASIIMPKIDRIATITSAPNFNDEQNPTITYSNPAGNSVTTLQASIYLPDGTTGLAYYRDISKTGTSYTFNLTEDERNRLRINCTNAKSRTVRFYVRTILGGTTYTNILEKTLTIVNANPTMTYTKVENNSDVINYLGSSSADTVIKNASNVTISVTPTAYKSATISSVIITHNGVNISAVENDGVYSATFDITGDTTTITTTDSRGNTVSEVWEPTVIEYQKVKQNSFSFKRVNPTSSNITFTLDSIYYQQTFGSTANAPTIKWKLDEGNWTTLTSSQYTIDTTNNKVTVNTTLNNVLSYMNNGTFYVEVSDLLSTWTNSMNVTKGIPVFEYGEDDVQVNGDFYIADTNRENKINVGKKIEKNIISAYFTSNYTLSTTGSYLKLPIDNSISVGTKLTLDTTNHNIVIGAGVSKIKIGAKVSFNSVSATGVKWLTIFGISGGVESRLSSNPNTLSARGMVYSTDTLAEVQEGNTIHLSVLGTSGDVVRSTVEYTTITVEVVE